MSVQNKKTRQIIKILKNGGWVSSGVCLMTAEDMLASQKEWNESDDSKADDFTTAPFWMTTNDGIGPISITSDRDLVEYLPDLFCFKVNSLGLEFIQETLKKKTFDYCIELHELQPWVDELEYREDEGSTVGVEMSSRHTKSKHTESLSLSNEHFSVEKIA